MKLIDHYINQYGKRLYGLCLTLCANPSEADDLYQDTWLQVIKNFDRYDSERPFEPWLTRICVNLYRNILRRLGRTPVFNGFASTEEKQRVIDAVQAKASPDYSDLYEGINNLSDKLRTTVILFYFQDMDIKATAKVLAVPEGTVKSRLDKAKKKLKERLGDETDL